MLNIELFKNEKNLLAFSGGVDSSALFFLLLEHKISFDIAIVNYNTRQNSNKEEKYAKSLAKKYNLICYSLKAPLFKAHFEENARNFRYNFFEELIKKYNYTTLITAHQLNDQLEWLFMRLGKGAGVVELIGLNEVTKKENYKLIRPLLKYSKDELLDYLKKNNYFYFIDQTNFNPIYERNYIRKNFANEFLKKYKKGVKKSFEYLKEDKESLEDFEVLHKIKELRVIKINSKKAKVRSIDKSLKELNYLLSSSQREEIKNSKSLVIGGIWAIEIVEDKIYISPYLKIKMPKTFKEKCRVLNIPPKIRSYLFKEDILSLL